MSHHRAASSLCDIMAIASSPRARSASRLAEMAMLLSSVSARDVGYIAGEPLQPSTVCYRHIAASSHCTIGVFELGRDAAMPLHDHPGAVLSHVLGGAAEVVCFHLSPDASVNLNDLGSAVPARFAGRARIGAGGAGGWITHTHNNVHAFRSLEAPSEGGWSSGGGCAILDVVLPPYAGSRHDLTSQARATSAVRSSVEDGLCTYFEMGESPQGEGTADAFALMSEMGAPVLLRSLKRPPPEPLPAAKPPLAVAFELDVLLRSAELTGTGRGQQMR